MSESEEPMVENRGAKVLLGSVGTTFLVGAIFWAGATYNRVQGIELRLASIETAIGKIGNIQTLEVQVQEHQRRLDRLENSR